MDKIFKLVSYELCLFLMWIRKCHNVSLLYLFVRSPVACYSSTFYLYLYIACLLQGILQRKPCLLFTRRPSPITAYPQPHTYAPSLSRSPWRRERRRRRGDRTHLLYRCCCCCCCCCGGGGGGGGGCVLLLLCWCCCCGGGGGGVVVCCCFGSCGRAVLDLRSRGLGFNSYTTGRVKKPWARFESTLPLATQQ